MKIIFRLISAVVTISVICVVTIYVWINNNKSFLEQTIVHNKEVSIQKGENFRSVYDKLTEDLDTPYKFYDYLKYINIPSQIKFGYYYGDNISLSELLNQITNGIQSTVKVTIPEGFNVFDIANAVDKAGITSRESFLKVVFDRDFIKELTGKDYTSMEGFLYPGTYHFPKNFYDKELVKTLYNEFKKNLPKDFAQKAKEKGLTEYEALIVASIVQKETYKLEESPIVASVFLNRLRINMPMQADPTILYGNFMRNRFEIKISKNDLRDKTNVYNTYTIPSLPPTPICNPSNIALEAVARPANTKYLYFVANKKGEHLFSENYDTHRKYVNTHQKQ